MKLDNGRVLALIFWCIALPSLGTALAAEAELLDVVIAYGVNLAIVLGLAGWIASRKAVDEGGYPAAGRMWAATAAGLVYGGLVVIALTAGA